MSKLNRSKGRRLSRGASARTLVLEARSLQRLREEAKPVRIIRNATLVAISVDAGPSFVE